MGLSFRKSIRVGPLRFNLSKSGIGMSAGIPGFRMGAGPRGNYVQIGVGGIAYRTTQPSGRAPGGISARASSATGVPMAMRSIPANTAGPMIEIESAHISQLVDSSSEELLNEIQRKRRRPKYAIIVAVAASVWTAAAYAKLVWPWPLVVLLASIGLCLYAHLRDVLARTTVLFYDFDEKMEEAFEGLLAAGKRLATANGFWHVQGEARVHDRRYHAGAGGLSSLAPSSVSFTPPTFLRTNVEIFSIPVGRQILHFFPDRVLIEDPAGVGAASYRDLTVDAQNTRFIEERPVPRDTEVVGQTWRYLNKNGTPDRRFKDNRQIPICLYAEIHLNSPSGLNERVMVSRPELAQYFSEYLLFLKSRYSS